MIAKDFFKLVAKMRNAQKQYFAQRTKEWLIIAKDLESQVDAEIARVELIILEKDGEEKEGNTKNA